MSENESNDIERLYWLAVRQLRRRGVKAELAASWSDRRLLRVRGFGEAKLRGWRSVFPLTERVKWATR